MGIQFHVPGRRKQVIFVQDARAEPSLEELPAYAFREVLQSGIAKVSAAFLTPVKHLHRADAPLGYMVGVTRNNDA